MGERESGRKGGGGRERERVGGREGGGVTDGWTDGHREELIKHACEYGTTLDVPRNARVH